MANDKKFIAKNGIVTPNLEVTSTGSWDSSGFKVTGAAPSIYFDQTDSYNAFVGVNGANFFVLDDKDSNGFHDGSPYPFKVDFNGLSAYIYDNQIWHEGNDDDLAKLGTTSQATNYLHINRDSTNSTLYVNQIGSGDIAKFLKGDSTSSTSSTTSQVTIGNTGSISMLADTPRIYMNNTTETNAGIYFSDNDAPGTQNAAFYWSSGTQDFTWHINGSQHMVLTDAGNVGIGTTSPSQALDVSGNIAVSGTVDGVDIAGSIDQDVRTTAAPTFAGGIASGDIQGYKDYSCLLDFSSDAAGTWRKLVDVTLIDNIYSNIGFTIRVIDNESNHAPSTAADNVSEETYTVHCSRTDSTVLGTPDACYVYGPSDRIRAVKTAVGTYEIQVQNETQGREYRIDVKVHGASESGHTVSYSNGGTASTGIAQYNASVSSSAIANFQSIAVKGDAIVDGKLGIGTTNLGDSKLRIQESGTFAEMSDYAAVIQTYGSATGLTGSRSGLYVQAGFNRGVDIARFSSIGNGYVDVPRMTIEDSGDFSLYNSDGSSPDFNWDASASALGIGTTSPTSGYKLDVNGSVIISNQFVVDTNTLYVRADTDRVGINTSTPSEALDVSGNIAVSGTVDGVDIAGSIDQDVRTTASPSFKDITLSKDNPLLWVNASSSGETVFDGSSLNGGVLLTAGGMNTSSKYTPAVMFGSTDPQFTTTNPKVGAAIVGVAAETYAADTDGAMNIEFWTSPVDVGTTQGALHRSTILANGDFVWYEDDGSSEGARWDASASALGIGTTSPTSGYKLDVAGAAIVSGQFVVDTDTLYVRADTDRVGINTSTPSEALDVVGNIDVTGNIFIPASTTEGRRIEIGSNRTGTNYGYAYIDLIGDSTYSDYGLRVLRGNTGPNANSVITHKGTGNLILQTEEAGNIQFNTTGSTRAVITADGKIGIGTTNPAYALDVNGTIQATAYHWTHPTSGAVDVGWEDDFLRYRFGGTTTPKGIRLDNYNTIGIELHRTGDAYFAGDITVDGTVDGVDVAALKAKVDDRSGWSSGVDQYDDGVRTDQEMFQAAIDDLPTVAELNAQWTFDLAAGELPSFTIFVPRKPNADRWELTEALNLGDRSITFLMEGGARIGGASSGSNLNWVYLNAPVIHERGIHMPGFANKKDTTNFALTSGSGALGDREAGISGYNPDTVATQAYQHERGRATLYQAIGEHADIKIPGTGNTFTAISFTPGTPLSTYDTGLLRVGMFVDTVGPMDASTGTPVRHTSRITGWVEDVNGQATIINVEQWYKPTVANPYGASEAATPPPNTAVVINPVNKLWGGNINVFLTSTDGDTYGYTSGSAIELGFYNGTGIEASNDFDRDTHPLHFYGFDAAILPGSNGGGFPFLARGGVDKKWTASFRNIAGKIGFHNDGTSQNDGELAFVSSNGYLGTAPYDSGTVSADFLSRTSISGSYDDNFKVVGGLPIIELGRKTIASTPSIKFFSGGTSAKSGEIRSSGANNMAIETSYLNIDGNLILDSNTNNNALYISRLGSITSQYLAMSMDDGSVWFKTNNDETNSAVRFTFENTDTETGGGAAANSSIFSISSYTTGLSLNLNEKLTITDTADIIFDDADTLTISTDTTSNIFTLGPGGTVSLLGEISAKRFIDSDNTDYYADFANTNTSIYAAGVVTSRQVAAMNAAYQRTAALTTNDGYGNANIAFNHYFGVPEKAGNSGRITVNVDSISNASMIFQLKSNSTTQAVTLTNILELYETSADFNVDVNSSSDIRLKKDIKPITNALEKVLKIDGVTFTRKINNKRSLGVIAQQVEAAMPEAVSVDSSGMKTVAYGNLAGLLIEAIKEQQKQINELRQLLEDK